MLKIIFFSDHSALVMLIHGFAEHLAVYDELGLRLAAEGALVFGHDHGISLHLFSALINLKSYMAISFSGTWPE